MQCELHPRATSCRSAICDGSHSQTTVLGLASVGHRPISLVFALVTVTARLRGYVNRFLGGIQSNLNITGVNQMPLGSAGARATMEYYLRNMHVLYLSSACTCRWHLRIKLGINMYLTIPRLIVQAVSPRGSCPNATGVGKVDRSLHFFKFYSASFVGLQLYPSTVYGELFGVIPCIAWRPA